MTTSDNNETIGAGNVDPAVSAQYRRIATECAPIALNRAVIQAARSKGNKKTFTRWRSEWFKPTAFVVMFALSFALILEMNDANILPTGFFKDEQLAPPGGPTNVFQEAAEAVSEQVRDAEAAASSAIQNSGTHKPATMETAVNSDQLTERPQDPTCDDEQRSTMTNWWRCIEALEKSGASAAAERELVELTRAFPGFIQPD